MKTLLTCLLIAIFSISVHAQTTSSGVSSDGRDFYVGFVNPSYNTVASPQVKAFFGAYVLISSFGSSRVTVSYFDRKTGAEFVAGTYFIPQRTGIQVPLDSAHIFLDTNDFLDYAACHITATSPVNVEFFSVGACAGGSYLALATPALGKKYVIASYNNNGGNLGLLGGDLGPTSIEQSRGFFLITAPFDSTTVTIISNSTTSDGHPGYHSGSHPTYPLIQPYSVLLRRGQSYLVKSARGDDEGDDISGSIVESDKPISVLGGQENAALGGVSNRQLEGRDYMVEQMIPVDFWDTSGYVSIPLKDSQPDDPSQFYGAGDDYRTYCYDKIADISLYSGDVSGAINMSTAKLAQPPPERFGETFPVDFESNNSVKFSVMMYDNRMFANAAPYPAPSMMTIIPISRWKTSYAWYVPANKFEVFQAYYVNIIGQTQDFSNQGGIMVSYNGGAIKPISTVINLDQRFKGSIPNHPELTGIRYKLAPGSYYATGPHPFIVYNYGFRAFDPDYDLGDFDGDDFFFEYANPVGASLSSGDTANFSFTIDSQCTKWNICVHDQRKNNPGIRSISLLNDSLGIQFITGEQSFNVSFDAITDPGNFGEVELAGSDSIVCFSVLVNKPSLPAFAAVLITDNAGNEKVLSFRNAPPKISVIPNASPINFGIHGSGSDTCITTTIINKDAAYSATIKTESIGGSGLFSVSSIEPTLPAVLKPNDSLVLKICYSGKDTSLVSDTLRLTLDCAIQYAIALQAQGNAPVISAGDINFGYVDTGTTVCKNDTIRNIGISPLILSKGYLISDTQRFSVSANVMFPLTILPGQYEVVPICYTPGLENDSAKITWTNNESGNGLKDFSLLRGIGIVPPLQWNVPTFTYVTDTVSQQTNRFLLENLGATSLNINSVSLSGPDSAQFNIIGNQTGNIPMSNFTLAAGAIWVDIRFTPVLSGNPPSRYADRHAKVIATSSGEKSAILDLTAVFGTSGVAINPSQNSLTIRPNPANGNSIIVSFGDAPIDNAELKIFDVLGHEMYKRNILGANQIEIPIRSLQNGIYYAQVVIGGKVMMQKFEVMR